MIIGTMAPRQKIALLMVVCGSIFTASGQMKTPMAVLKKLLSQEQFSGCSVVLVMDRLIAKEVEGLHLRDITRMETMVQISTCDYQNPDDDVFGVAIPPFRGYPKTRLFGSHCTLVAVLHGDVCRCELPSSISEWTSLNKFRRHVELLRAKRPPGAKPLNVTLVGSVTSNATMLKSLRPFVKPRMLVRPLSS